jgi:hypothetical protein
MNGRAFVLTGVQPPFEAREAALPGLEPDAHRALTCDRDPLTRTNEAFAHADWGQAIRAALVCAPDLVRDSQPASPSGSS